MYTNKEAYVDAQNQQEVEQNEIKELNAEPDIVDNMLDTIKKMAQSNIDQLEN